MIIQSERIWINEHFEKAQLEIEHGKVSNIYAYNSHEVDMDYGNLYVLPGFIDIHTHGNNGVEASQGNASEMNRWQKEITRDGVTSFLPSLASQSEEDNLASFTNLSKTVGKGDGAEILGIYMEGNYISKHFKGAHDENFIVKPNLTQLKKYIEASNNTLKLMILAIEEDQDYEVLSYAYAHNIVVSVGHSGAHYEQVKEAMKYGIQSVTHTYNAMIPYHHREAGIIGAALDIPSLYTEVIADGHHVSWPCIRILGKMKDKDHLILVSDASPLKGFEGPLPENVVKDEEGQFRTLNGNLCSSSLRICDGVKNLITHADLAFVNAINAATINPAKLLHVDDRKGSLDVGKDADIVICTPDFEVQKVYCKGIIQF